MCGVPADGEPRPASVEIEIRGFNIRPTFIPAFIKCTMPEEFSRRLDPDPDDGLINALRDTVTADDESMVGLFNM